jgi:hypothetical protein
MLKILSSIQQAPPGEKGGEAPRYKYAKTVRIAFFANPASFKAVCRAIMN